MRYRVGMLGMSLVLIVEVGPETDVQPPRALGSMPGFHIAITRRNRRHMTDLVLSRGRREGQ
jgi:hypothetical protein